MRSPRSKSAGIRQVARILREALENGRAVEIDGLGTFLPGRKWGFRFVAQVKPRVFIAYVEEDLGSVKKIYDVFEKRGLRPWLDKKKLMPGQNWPRAIETAIETSDFFVACFSGRSTTKRGAFQSELRYALTCAGRIPLDEIFFIPIRLENCVVPGRISKQLQYIDLFPDWQVGMNKVLAVMESQGQGPKRKRLSLSV
jgi:hypothetical protein